MFIISGTVRQIKLYKYLGFTPFGPLVGTEGAQYQPMYAAMEAYRHLQDRSRSFAKDTPKLANDDTVLFIFLPGPVDFAQQVQEVYKEKPLLPPFRPVHEGFSGRSEVLCDLSNATQVQVLMGPGRLPTMPSPARSPCFAAPASF